MDFLKSIIYNSTVCLHHKISCLRYEFTILSLPEKT
uniref:Uncharacterized protein n=1 Tax=Siphoviridae sp. ctDIL13 TaxID=2827811 RepID=A0A8S5SXL3_9CAUD|nr:MAG TPA: hypothetical protein [Siphoviridae sp. ctDIL13]DAP85686.1 MAG TPA: hypothetical protein [Caudoviricetes sp.]DAQ09093.1 MAG TPA: hypothetical protein [Caudoviricetes sp.]DAQ95043.1 MAG TPA: hypothetical protein [Caudoviricetes sp.]